MSKKYEEAVRIVKEHTVYSMVAVGLTPTPGGDTVSAVSIQTLMLKRINEIYGIQISRDILLKIIGLATSGVSTFEISKYITGGLAIPIQVVSTATLTYALGMAYTQVIEKGATISVREVGENIPKNIKEAAQFVSSEGVRKAAEYFGEKFWNATEATAKTLERMIGKSVEVAGKSVVFTLEAAKSLASDTGELAYDAGKAIGDTTQDIVTETVKVAYKVGKKVGDTAKDVASESGKIAYRTGKKIVDTTEDVASTAGKIAYKTGKKIIKKINPFNW